LTLHVVGNATVDLLYRVARLPRPGETILASERLVDAGGKGLNQAVVARRAGAEVCFRAVIGGDASAAVILERLAGEGLDARDLGRWPGPTDESLIMVAESGENAIVSTAGAAASFAPDKAAAALEGARPGDLLLLQGNLSRATTLACLKAARARGVRTMLNPAPIHFAYDGLWPYVDWAVLNEVEAERLGGTADVAAAAEALRRAGAARVVATLGPKGAVLFGGDARLDVPAPAVAVVDTTGAGDTVCGVLAAGIAADMAEGAALAWAVDAASLACTRPGTSSSFPSPAELEELRRAALAR
jgi:ribokinase